MKCEKCHKNEATVFITQNINGEVVEMNLCEVCAGDEDQPILDEALSFQQFLTGFMENSKGQTKSDVTVCPACGMSLKDFKQHSKVGCAACYKTFEGHLMPAVKRLHGTLQHTGKVPDRIGQVVHDQKLLEDYEARLKVALMTEDYEKAAFYRDRIRELKEEGSYE